jgi:hypothetical protein
VTYPGVTRRDPCVTPIPRVSLLRAGEPREGGHARLTGGSRAYSRRPPLDWPVASRFSGIALYLHRTGKGFQASPRLLDLVPVGIR